MLRLLFSTVRLASQPPLLSTVAHKFRNWNTVKLVSEENVRQFSSVLTHHNVPSPRLLADPKVQQISNNIITRNLIKYSMRKGKRKSVKAVLKRFYRLDWGIWIRTKCGRHKKLWKKSPPRKRRLRQHVFCNATQSTMLDKMVGHYWKKPKYYVDDPYQPYHTREEYRFTAMKPRPYFPPEDH